MADLFGIGFELSYDPALLQLDAVAPGPFLDADPDNLVFFAQTDTPGTAGVSVSRRGDLATSGVDGNGTVVTLTFTVHSPDAEMTTPFGFSDVLANDSDGAVLPLDLQGGEVTIATGLVVWPGDTDNAPDPVTGFDVSAADVLAVGIYYGTTGPARNGTYDPTWEPQPAEPWTPVEATYADATGTGEVEPNDVLPIALNYGRTRMSAAASPAPVLAASPSEPSEQGVAASARLGQSERAVRSPSASPAMRSGDKNAIPKVTTLSATAGSAPRAGPVATVNIEPQPVGTRVEIAVDIGTEAPPLTDILGLHLQLFVPDVLDYVEVESGPFIDDGDLLRFDVFTPEFEASTGLVDAAFTRKAGNAPAGGDGRAVLAAFDVVEEITEPITVELITIRVSRTDGSVVSLTADDVELEPIVTVDAEDDPESGVPTRVAIEAAYPNPFSATSTVRYALPHSEPSVRLVVFDLMGRHVATLAQGPHDVGYHEATWDASGVASGVYFLRLVVGETIRNRRVTLLR